MWRGVCLHIEVVAVSSVWVDKEPPYLSKDAVGMFEWLQCYLCTESFMKLQTELSSGKVCVCASACVYVCVC